MLLGVMREAEVIPSSGDPLADLLVAFVPFTVAGLYLCRSDVAEEAQTIDRDELRPPKLGASDNDSLEIWEGNRKSSIYFGAVGNDDEKMTTNTTKTATVAVAALALVAMTLAYSALVLPASAQLASTSTTTPTTPTT